MMSVTLCSDSSVDCQEVCMHRRTRLSDLAPGNRNARVLIYSWPPWHTTTLRPQQSSELQLLLPTSVTMQLSKLSAIALLTRGIQAAAVLRFGCSQIVVERLDPLVNPSDNPSPHVHQASLNALNPYRDLANTLTGSRRCKSSPIRTIGPVYRSP
ncbi:hypothetical protein PG990_013852 [Apiospora arundinis]